MGKRQGRKRILLVVPVGEKKKLQYQEEYIYKLRDISCKTFHHHHVVLYDTIRPRYRSKQQNLQLQSHTVMNFVIFQCNVILVNGIPFLNA